jgi:hypothetical protein
MKYTVLWLERAESELATAWLEAPNRSAASAAANAIDGDLRVDPGLRGESRPAGYRILLVSPLGVLFRIEPQDRIARVLKCWRFDRRQRFEG